MLKIRSVESIYHGNFVIKVVLFVAMIFIFSLTIPSSVFAISPYDNAVRPANGVVVDKPQYTGSKNFAFDWYETIQASTNVSCTTAIKESLETVFADGDWSIVQYVSTDWMPQSKAIITWRNDHAVDLIFENYWDVPSLRTPSGVNSGWFSAQIYQNGNDQYAVECSVGRQTYFVSSAENLPNGEGFSVLLSTFGVSYPSGYEGLEVPSSTASADMDGDGLTGTQESAQGTSNANEDTDGDGLDDFIESQWNPDRDDVFCSIQCAYPDPTTKDVYVEIDWMNNPSDGSYQPSSTQLNQVKTAFNARGINVHFDTGQYGGGNELPSYEQTLPFVQNTSSFDFYDYKNGTENIAANFDSDRKRIWHYMVSGYRYAENTGSSGVSYAGDDDLFISYGLIKDSQSSFGYTDLDTAIAGTVIHELGHNLCLTDTAAYSGQAGDCVYSGIDNVNASSDYESSMNYSYQMFMVDYSTGINGAPNDHDDWYAIDIGMKDFSNTDRDAGDIMNGKSMTKKLIQGISIDQAKDLRKKNKLGKRNINYFTRPLQMLVR